MRKIIVTIALLLGTQGWLLAAEVPETISVTLSGIQPVNITCPYCSDGTYWIQSYVSNGTYYLSLSEEYQGVNVVRAWDCNIPAWSQEFTLKPTHCVPDYFLNKTCIQGQDYVLWSNYTGIVKLIVFECVDGTFGVGVYGNEMGHGQFFGAVYRPATNTYLDTVVENTTQFSNHPFDAFCVRGNSWYGGYGGLAIVTGLYVDINSYPVMGGGLFRLPFPL